MEPVNLDETSPISEVSMLPQAAEMNSIRLKRKRPIGLAKDMGYIAPDAFESMSDEELSIWYEG